MADYDYGRERTTRYVERRERDPRDGHGRDSYLRVDQSRQLVPRSREDSDLSVEEVHRDFPPPGYVRDIRRARSAEPGAGAYYDDDTRSVYRKADRYDDRYYDDRDRGYDRYDDRDRDRDRDRHSDRDRGHKSSRKDEEETHRRVLSKQEKIIAALVGGAIAVGGKELYDRREAKQEHNDDVHRNPLASAALGAAGALAAYQGADFYNKKASEKEKKESTLIMHKSRDGRVTTGYYSEDEDSKEKKGSDNFLEKALAAAGLGGAAKMLLGGSGGDDKKDNKSDTRSRAGSKSRSKSPKGGTNKVQKAAMASLIAGATEAFRVSKEPGGWRGEKAKRVLTAAAGAATIDSVQGEKKEGSKLGLAESVIGGLLGNRLIHGSKNNIEEDKATGRSRSRSRARSKSGGGGGGASGIAALATAGLGAIGAKKIMDNRKESRERSRDRSRRRSPDSYDSRDNSPEPRKRSRSRSVVDSARRSLAKIGIGNGPEDDRDRDHDSRDSRRRRNDYDDGDSYARDRGHGRRDDYYDDDRSHRDRSRSRSRGGGGRRRRGSYSSSDLGDSDEDEKKARKIRGKSILTTGLAAVATIHATHNVVQSMEKRNSRHKAVREGRLTAEEAKKLKSKAMLQDAASVGIAALGIKGAISEMKEAKEKIHELHQWQDEKKQRHERRVERQQRNRKRIEDVNWSDRDNRRRQDDDYSDADDERYYYPRRTRADNWCSGAPARSNRYDDAPYYNDGNPYAALPAPPVGRDRDRDDRDDRRR